MLYAGKASGVLITLLFIPLYNRQLGPAQFGMAAVLLSLQALLIMLDFGLSTIISRDIASAQMTPKQLWAQVRDAERALLGFYLVLLVASLIVRPLGFFGHLSLVTLVCSIALFGFLVQQNLHYCAILACRAYIRASAVQLAGNLLRAVATALVLVFYSATLEAFVIVQAIFAALQAWGTRLESGGVVRNGAQAEPGAGGSWASAARLVRRSAALAVFAAAGAAVMQLDKPIISAFMSSTAVGPYFLAMTLSLVPTSVLAGPVTQYFQPRVLGNLHAPASRHAEIAVERFTATLLAATLLPCVLIWVLRVPLITLWLGHQQQTALVAQYAGILLPGVMVGALGYIPYTLLLGAQDYKFQGMLSLTLAAATLAAVVVAALRQSAAGVAVVYACYHTASTTLSWARAVYLTPTRKLAMRSGRLALASLSAALTIMAFAGQGAVFDNLR